MADSEMNLKSDDGSGAILRSHPVMDKRGEVMRARPGLASPGLVWQACQRYGHRGEKSGMAQNSWTRGGGKKTERKEKFTKMQIFFWLIDGFIAPLGVQDCTERGSEWKKG